MGGHGGAGFGQYNPNMGGGYPNAYGGYGGKYGQHGNSMQYSQQNPQMRGAPGQGGSQYAQPYAKNKNPGPQKYQPREQ